MKSKIALIKNIQDNRYDETGIHVCTHNGTMKIKADFNVAGLDEIPNLESYDHIFIDEMHFFPDVVNRIKQLLVQTTARIYITGLNGTCPDENGIVHQFECLASLSPYATETKIIPAVCMECSSDALFTVTTPFGKEQHKRGIFVGGFSMYQSRCAQCMHK